MLATTLDCGDVGIDDPGSARSAASTRRSVGLRLPKEAAGDGDLATSLECCASCRDACTSSDVHERSLAPFVRLHFQQRVWRFSGTLVPPLDTGMM
jgi:hypothetical protein